jgi:hypothetical protein
MLGIFGSIDNPTSYGTAGDKGQGLFDFLSNIFKFAAVAGGIYFIVQIILAGFEYISANGDQKKLENAWAKIWQSLIGLAIISAAFVIAGVVGRLTGLNILEPKIYGPNQ